MQTRQRADTQHDESYGEVFRTGAYEEANVPIAARAELGGMPVAVPPVFFGPTIRKRPPTNKICPDYVQTG